MRWLLVLLLLASASFADVTRKQTVTSQFMGASEGTTTQYYSGDHHATESTMRWTSGFMKTASGGKPVESGTIVRLDKQVVWTLSPKDKTYQEMTFAEFRDMMKKGITEANQAQQEHPDTVAEEMYSWTVQDKSDSQAKVIHGWNCKNVDLEATGVNKKDSLDKVVITINLWNSSDVPGVKEMADFNLRYMQALGLGQEALTPGLNQASLLYQKQFSQLIEASKKAPGEPVQSLMEIKHYQLKGPDIGKAVGEGVKNELMGKLPFGKKKAAAPEKPVYDWNVKFSTTSELTEATMSAVDAAKFEIPAGYKLKK